MAQFDCPTSFIVTQKPTADETINSGDTLISSIAIDSLLNVNYTAGETVILRPGFEVKNGATFLAKIEACIPTAPPKYFVLLDEENVIVEVDSNILTLSSSTIEDSLEVGVYIVSGSQEFLPKGFIGKITNLTKSSNQIILATSEASITDFIKEGKASGEIELTSADVEIDSSDFTFSQGRSSGFGKTINQTFGNEHGFITIDGQANLTFSLIYDFDIGNFRASEIELGIKTDLNSSVSIYGEYMRDDFLPFSKNINLGTIVFKTKTVPLTVPLIPFPIPITFTPKLRLDLNSEGKISASFSANASAELSGINTIKYVNNKFEPRQEFTFSASGSKHFNAEASIKSEIIAGLEVEFYNNKGSLYVGTGYVGEAEAKIDLEKGLECSLKVSPKIIGQAKINAFGLLDSLRKEKVFEPSFEDSTICKPCNLQIVDSTIAQISTSGNFELRVRVTTSCGNLPVISHPVVWSYTVGETDYDITSFTDQNGLAKLNWSVLEPRVFQETPLITVCADQETCRHIFINRESVGLTVSISRLNAMCDDEGNNDASISGTIGLNVRDFQYQSNFATTTGGDFWTEIVPIFYSTGNPDSYPVENRYDGIFYYTYDLNTNSGFLGQIAFSLTRIGGSILKDINLAGDPREEIRGNRKLKYRNHGHGTGPGVTVTISPYNTGGNCWSPFSGDNNVDVVPIVQEPLANFYTGGNISENLNPEKKLVNNLVRNVKIFPNPANNTVTISFKDPPKSNTKIEIIDLYGNTVITKSTDVYSNTTTMDIGALARGTYFIKCHTRKELLIKKLIVQN